MSKLFTENPPKIYLKDSDKVRLADYRARIVRETNPREPCDNEDLVFEKADGEVPAEAIHTWYFAPMGVTFYTTPERCKEMVSEDPSYWTQKKLEEFAKIEGRLYRDWWDGHVYGYIIEKWDAKRREWMHTSSLWGMYGAEELMLHLAEETDGVNVPICIDSEDLKHEFDNVEMRPNQFS